jgi:hypothetical protein
VKYKQTVSLEVEIRLAAFLVFESTNFISLKITNLMSGNVDLSTGLVAKLLFVLVNL